MATLSADLPVCGLLSYELLYDGICRLDVCQAIIFFFPELFIILFFSLLLIYGGLGVRRINFVFVSPS